MGPGKGGSILVQRGTNNAEREGTTAIVRKSASCVCCSQGTRRRELVIVQGLRVSLENGSFDCISYSAQNKWPSNWKPAMVFPHSGSLGMHR